MKLKIYMSFKSSLLFFTFCFIKIKCDDTPSLIFSGDNQKRPGLGVNVGPINSNMGQWVFTNKFKHAREWRPCSSNNFWTNYSWAGAFNTTWSSDGWPIWFNFNPYGSSFLGYQTEIGTYGSYPAGDYVLTLQGTGNITLLGDATNVKQINSNRFEFTVTQPSVKGIVIILNRPNVTSIDLREKFEEFSNDIFGKNYTNALKIFEALRFSPWMIGRDGNNVPNMYQDWSTRRPVTYYTQHGQQMVSIEYLVELANFLNKNIWLSIPSSASSSYTISLAQYVKNNLINSTSLIYVEQSSDKGFNNNNRALNMQLITDWKSVFGNDTRVKYVMSTWLGAYYENTVSMYTADDIKQFHAFSIGGDISYEIEFNFDGYNITLSNDFTVDTILDMIRQQIYKDEIRLIYLIQKCRIGLNLPLIGYNVGFNVHAPGFSDRSKKTNNSDLEQRLENLVIEAMRQPKVKDLYLDFMHRWYKSGGDLMFLSNIVDYANPCLTGGGKCGYKSILEHLGQNPQNVPKYQAAIKWLNGENGDLPFTSDDMLPQIDLPCSPECAWGTCYDGKCVCFDGYTGTTCDTLGKKFLDCHSTDTEYGVNVGGIPDWSTELTFIDLTRRARQWIVQKIVFSTKWADWNQTDVQLRDDGYPKYLEIGKTVGTAMTRDLNAHYPNGDYVCLYDGDGVLEFMFVDTQITKRDAGRIEMKVTHKTEMNNGIYYSILRTNPSNPIRNVRIFEARFEKIYKKFPYHPRFLEFMRKFKTIRFMPWSNVFVDQIVDWSNITTDDYYTFNLKTGVSLEKQVLLANTLGANPWFNLPHIATDEYITKWASYVRDYLRPDVTIYIEVGNECWGSGGPHECGNYAQKMGYAENMTIIANQSYYSKELVGRICYHAKTGQRYLNMIKQVFGQAYSSNRVKLVINSQAAWTGPLDIFFLCKGNFSESYDVVAIAPYMSESMKKPDGSLVTVDEFFNTTAKIGILNAFNCLKQISNMIKAYAPRMKLAFYEAGPDFSSLTDTSNTELTNLSITVHRDTRMYQALRDYLTNMTKTNGIKLDTYLHFYTVSTYTKYGCWGLTESSDSNLSNSPKYLAYMDHIDSERSCDWNEKPNNCINNCSSNGVCSINQLTNSKEICTCYFGSSGQFCSDVNYIKSERCTYQCGGRGTCSFDHIEGYYLVYTCHCNPGYYGYGCELFDCTNECNYNGKCVDNDTCTCFRGFKGKYCDIDCGCKSHGSCSNSSNECACDLGYKLVNGYCELDCSINPTRNECLFCPDCGYGTCVNGKCFCWAGYTQDVRKSCTLKVTAKNDGSKIGINVNGVVDWGTQWAFLDLGKQGRNWIIQYMDKLNTLYLWSLKDQFNLTDERYPAEVPYQRQLVTLMLRDVQKKWPSDIYHVFFDGEGILDFGFDATVLEYNEKYRMKIRVTLSTVLDNGVFMKIRKTNPKNPLRNIRIVQDGFQDIYDKIPFHPVFMERLAKFRTIRFMPWTEEVGIVNWSDRITPTTYTQGKGVAYEYQILLCNIMKANPWFIVPFGASDEFVTEMAKLVYKNLRKDLTIYVEYTNEAWNTLFESGKYCQSMGLKLGLSNDSVIARNYYYSKRSQEIIKLWKNVFGQEDNRIVLVLGSFVVMPVISTRILEYNNAYLSHSNILLAVTGYISCGSPSAAYVAQNNLTTLLAGCDSDLPNVNATLRAHLAIAKSHNVKLGMYESGTGLSEYQAIVSGSETPGATDKYLAWNRDPRMYDVYMKYYRLHDQLNMTENNHYAYCERPSKYGTWELLEFQNQSLSEAHRYRAIMDIIDETKVNLPVIQNVYCFGKLYNETDVCNGKGICIAQDTCQNFNLPTRNSEIQVSPLQGISLVDNFLLSTDAWSSDFPLKYAYGIKHYELGNIRLTDFIDSPKAITILPYIGQPFQIVLYVKDSLNREFIDVSTQFVTMVKYNGTQADLNTLVNRLSICQKSIALYDKSFVNKELIFEIINKIDLTGANLTEGILNLEYLSSKSKNQSDIVNIIGDKLDNFIFNISSNKSDISYEQSCLIVNVISNIYEQGSSDKAVALIENFASFIVKTNQTNQTIDGLPAVQFITDKFNISIANLDIKNLNSSKINYSDISADLSQIYLNNNNSKANIAVIKYESNLNESIASNQIDLKFYSNGSVLPVSNLSSPIVLQFAVDDPLMSLLNNQTSSFKLTCKYYDEKTNSWDSYGCSMSNYNLDTKVVYCSCNHTTKFAVVTEENVQVVSSTKILNELLNITSPNQIALTSSPKSIILFIFFYSTCILAKFTF